VAVTAIAHQIDDHVLLERLAKPDRESGRLHGGLGIVAIHVKDRGLDDLRDIARIGVKR